MRFVHLHAHSTFSFLDGYGTPAQIADRIVELNQGASAITDHGAIFGHVPMYREFEKRGLKLIFGCEFYICDDISIKDQQNHAPMTGTSGLPHITVIAQTQEGYNNLLKLSRLSYERGFYYKPRIDLSLLIQLQKGLIVLSGCPTGYPTRIGSTLGYEEMVKFLKYMHERIDNYYVEIVPQPGWDVSHKIAPMLWNAAIELGIPVVFTADAHFPKPEHYEYQDALLAVGLRTHIFDKERAIKLPDYQYYCSATEVLERAKLVLPMVPVEHLTMAVENSALIADSCNVTLKKADRVAFPGIPEGETSASVLWQWICTGWNNRLNEIPVERQQEYLDRLQKEFLVLSGKGFCDYMLAIADVVLWMKANNGLVVTRGSAGGCLILWILGVSETDPIMYELSFERFYDETRNDPPDVDIDFEQAKRAEAIEYIYDKYGRQNCSQIAALSRLKPKGAIQAAGSALNIHRSQYTALSEVINDDDMDMERQFATITDAKARAVLDKHPRLANLVKGMVGQYRHSSVHAAGILVSSASLDNVIGVLTSDSQVVAAIDKEGAEFMGFLKMDMLSVQSLDVIANAARLIIGGDNPNIGFIYNIPRNDQRVFNAANNGMLAGVFQLDGAAAKKALSQIGAHDFNDLVAASVLCRPGASDSIPIYKNNKNNTTNFSYYLENMHPIVAKIVESTYGVLMYQEQVMKIAELFAGLDMVHVHKLRRDVGKKMGLDPQKGDAWRAEWEDRFVIGALRHSGCTPDEAHKWWEAVQHHGGYSFNRAHAVTYGVVGYWMLWLKVYYPAQFYEAYLNLCDDPLVIKNLIMEFKKYGGIVEILSPEHSKESFSSVGPSKLVGGYRDLKFCGPVASRKMVEKGPFGSWTEMYNAMPKRTMELLKASQAESQDWNPSKLIAVAPWMPIPTLTPGDRELMRIYNLRSVSEMPKQKISGDSTCCGYVTITNFTSDKIVFSLDDDKDMVICRVASARVKELSPKFKELKEGDFIAATGWWADDTFFVKDYKKLREAS